MLDLEDIFGHGGPLAAGAAGLPGASRAAAHGAARRRRARRARVAGRGGGHRHRQDLRLPRAGAALRGARADLHRHAHAAGPAVRQGPAAGERSARAAGARGAAQGPRQLPVPLPPGARRAKASSCALVDSAATAPRRALDAGAHPALGAHHAARRSRRGARSVGFPAGVAAGHLDARELPRRALSGDLALPRGARAARGARG